jgi:hypothetical protein
VGALFFGWRHATTIFSVPSPIGGNKQDHHHVFVLLRRELTTPVVKVVVVGRVSLQFLVLGIIAYLSIPGGLQA